MCLADTPRFQIIEGTYTWNQATADAVTRGGRLAVLNTLETIATAKQVLSSSGSQNEYWIGLDDIENEGAWKWITGDLLTVSDWHQSTGEPNDGNGGGTEDGLGMMPLSTFRWDICWKYLSAGFPHLSL
jgi:hypothetical protein